MPKIGGIKTIPTLALFAWISLCVTYVTKSEVAMVTGLAFILAAYLCYLTGRTSVRFGRKRVE